MAEVSPIATRAELEQRLAARSKPVVERHLTIEGSQETEVRRQVDAFSENRIKTLQDRLERARQGLHQNRERVRAHGKAKASFERSR